MKPRNLFAATSAMALLGALALTPAHATDPDAALAAMKSQVFSTGPNGEKAKSGL